MRSLRRVLAAASVLLVAGSARAQSDDKAAAEALFEKGKAMMAAGRYADACPAFRESDRLDPGIGTKLRLADCYALTGKTASAWAEFKEAAELAAKDHDAREKVARKKAAELEPTLPKLVIEVVEPSDGLDVRRNGTPVGKATWGLPIPVDPGDVEVTASAPHKKPYSVRLSVEPKKTATASIPKLAAADEPAPAPVAIKPEPPPAHAEPPKEPPPSTWGTRRTLGVAVAAVGVVGLGVGGYFGLHAKSKLDASNDGHCRADDRCDATGISLRNEFLDAAKISTIAFAAGGALAVGGAVLFFTAPNGVTVGPAASAREGGVVVHGSF